MNDEQFEAVLDFIRRNWNSGGNPVAELRARDTAQREALARAKADHEANGLEYGEALILIGQVLDCRSIEDLNAVRRYLNEFMDRYSLRPVPDVDIVQAEQQEVQGAQAGDERAAFEAWFTEKSKTLPLLRGESVIRYHKGEGQYVSDWALFGHMVWQARAALATQPAVQESRELAARLTEALPARETEPHGGAMSFAAGWNQCLDAIQSSLWWKRNSQPATGEPVHQWADQDLWMDGDEADMASARAEGFKTRTLWTAPPASAPVAAGEPIQIEAVAVTREGDDGLYLDWVLEGGISALEAPGVVLLVAHGKVTDDQGSGEVYLAPPAAAHGDDGHGGILNLSTSVHGGINDLSTVAHGDEAVLWDLIDKSVYGSDEQQVVARAKIRRLLAMRAQGDGEVKA